MERHGSRPIDELIRLAMIGDGTAFTELWDTNIDSVKRYIRAFMKNASEFDVDDICSRSFEKAFRQISTYDPSKSQFPTWLKTIARNTSLDIMEQEDRGRRKFIRIDENLMNVSTFDSIPDQVDNALDNIIRTEDRQRTQGYIEALPELYREVARKRLLDCLQYKEIAEELNMELNTVRTRIRRAKALIDEMKNDADQ